MKLSSDSNTTNIYIYLASILFYLKEVIFEPGMMVHTCNPSALEVKASRWRFEAMLAIVTKTLP
jgi:hypothetical protein